MWYRRCGNGAASLVEAHLGDELNRMGEVWVGVACGAWGRRAKADGTRARTQGWRPKDVDMALKAARAADSLGIRPNSRRSPVRLLPTTYE